MHLQLVYSIIIYIMCMYIIMVYMFMPYMGHNQAEICLRETGVTFLCVLIKCGSFMYKNIHLKSKLYKTRVQLRCIKNEIYIHRFTNLSSIH
jgi:hypothetical protein